MNILSRIFSNTRKPEGFFGRMMVNGMNGGGHAKLAEWGLSEVSISEKADILDVGCGGGANIARLLRRAPQGKVTGIDYSPVSVNKSREVNAKAIAAGRCQVVEGECRCTAFRGWQFRPRYRFRDGLFLAGDREMFRRCVPHAEGWWLFCHRQ